MFVSWYRIGASLFYQERIKLTYVRHDRARYFVVRITSNCQRNSIIWLVEYLDPKTIYYWESVITDTFT